MTTLAHRIVARWLQAAPKGEDSVSEVTFEVGPDGPHHVSSYAEHPRIGACGLVTSIPLDTERPSESEDVTNKLFPKQWEDFDTLRKNIGKHDLKLYGVASSRVSRIFRAEGVGQRLYINLVAYLAQHGAALVPNSAYEGNGATSLAAQRVWKTLTGIVHVGDVFWGGALKIDLSPLPSRRGHGWQKYRQHKDEP